MPVLAVPRGPRPGSSVSSPGVGCQVPSTLASNHRALARHSGGRSDRAKGEISRLGAGLPAAGSPSTRLAPDPGAQGREGLSPGARGFPWTPKSSFRGWGVKEWAPPWAQACPWSVHADSPLGLPLKVSVLHRRAVAAGVVADRTGLTVTYTDVTGHSTSLRYHFPCDQACGRVQGRSHVPS